ncbi:CC0125/CC1285 family lipoprotein [Spectribacter hydrogenoxidans]|uniref:Uncharacterized protein n=1 Tax=Spectribacter hydrogenoxidans TaxID=3075608 RepID=A0ABU3BWV7_9GAMM|nr:hypothetical protein [Salinisphaera sp. W335]MDT0633773.1 hypothetical protein [Salinisphaera sp. W335]
MRLAPLITAGACLLGSACTSAPTGYRPAAGPDDAGYRTTDLGDGRWHIHVRGNAWTANERLVDLWQLRAATLALEQGANGFRTDAAPRLRPAFVMPQFGAASGGYRPGFQTSGQPPSVDPSRQRVAEGVIRLSGQSGTTSAVAICERLAPRFPPADCRSGKQ